MDKYYGQKETDRVIAGYFSDDYIGKCIEVGVADGVKGSNTKYFEDKGWDCLCIDPIPEHVEAARKVRNNVIECACTGGEGERDFFVVDLGERNIKSSLSGLEIDQRLLVTHGHLINKVEKITVKTDTLINIVDNFKDFNKIDFISIDTEGTEYHVLQGSHLYGPKAPYLFVVENNFEEDVDIQELLEAFDYKKTERYFVNDFYVKNK